MISQGKLKEYINDDKKEIEEYVNRIQNEGISICAWGTCGKLLYKWCENNCVFVKSIYDSDSSKYCRDVFGIKTKSYESINTNDEQIFVIATYNNYIFNEIYLKLKQKGVKSDNIFHVSLLENQLFKQQFDFKKYYKKYKNCVKILNNLEKIAKVEESLYDDYSKEVYLKMIARHYNCYEFTIPDRFFVDETYFDRAFFSYGDNEVLVQCGVLDGATIKDFIEVVPNYKQIVGIEADPINIKKSIWVENNKNVSIINKAIADTDQSKLSFCSLGNGRSHIISLGDAVLENTRDLAAMGESEEENYIIETIKGDSLGIVPTFIQMDIEGAELLALKGFERTIKENKPKLAICIYHSMEDFWEIPIFIHNLVPEYHFYVRNDGIFNKNNETVLYATV